MKGKIVMMFLMVLVLVFAASCNNTSGPAVPAGTYIGGNQGVALSFMESAPPAEVIAPESDGEDGEGFNIIVSVENQGEYDIKEGDMKIRIEGPNPSDFVDSENVPLTAANLESVSDVELPGMHKDVYSGTVETSPAYDFELPVGSDGESTGDISYANALQGSELTYNLMATLCYKYRTLASGQLCLKDDMTERKNTDVCTITGPKGISVSGGPIQIPQLEQTVRGKEKLFFTFTVTNSKNSKFFLSQEDDDEGVGINGNCNRDEDSPFDGQKTENYVRINIDTGYNHGTIRCTNIKQLGGGTAEGENGVIDGILNMRGINLPQKITCTQDLEGNMPEYNMQSIVQIQIDYDYEESIQTSMKVLHG
jgi:hypothetical protein